MRKHFWLCDDSYEATDTTRGYRHYKCTDEGSEEEYSYYTDPLVYTVNPKTGEKPELVQAVNPYLPNYELLPDNELHKFWSKKDREWRVYVTGSHDSYTTGMWCGEEVVCWSAPVYDLSDWRFEGVIKKGGLYFACDFAYDRMTDQAVFYAFPFFGNPEMMDGIHIWVNGTSDPGAEFTIPFCEAGIEGLDRNGWNFDPAIHIDPNGDIYVAFDIMHQDQSLPKYCQLTKLNADRTAIQWSVPIRMAEGQPNTEGYNPNHYEASTIDYAEEFGAYIIQYSYVAEEGEHGTGYYPLAYIYTFEKDLEHARWIWGGIIGDNSGRYRMNRKTGQIEDGKVRTCSWDNNHGGLVKINGKWYISNHRHTGDHACRQGFLEKVHMYMEDGRLKIDPVECTSSIDAPLDAYRTWPAHIQCYLTPACNYSLQDADKHYLPPACHVAAIKGESEKDRGFVYTDPDYAKHRTPIIGISDGVVIGYKYLDFGYCERETAPTVKLLFSMDKEYVDGIAEVWLDAPTAEEGGCCIGTVRVGRDIIEAAKPETVDTAGIRWYQAAGTMDLAVSGVHGLYFVFRSEKSGTICRLDEFQFV